MTTNNNNPISKRYPFEMDIAALPLGAQRCIRNAWNAIVDLQQASANHSTQITTLQKSPSTATASKPVGDPPLAVNPEIGITPVQIAGRVGISPTGGSSVNSSATAATNSSYSKGAYIAGINPQTSATAYTVQDSDYGGTIVFDSSSIISVALNSGVKINFSCSVMNVGAGGIFLSPLIVNLASGGTGYVVNDVLTIVQGGASGGQVTVTAVSGGIITAIQVSAGGTNYTVASGLSTTGGTGHGATVNIVQVGTVNGQTAASIQSGAFTVVSFDGTNWWAMSFTGVLPSTFTPVAHEFLTGYNAATGTFSAAQPAFTDISGNIATSQGPVGSFTGTVALAALTGGGTQGSLTVSNGWITAYTPPT